MFTNTLFAILASIIVVAVIIYLVAIKKGKPQSFSRITPTPIQKPDDEDDKDKL